MLLPEKIALGDWLPEGRAVLHVDLPVIFLNLVQAAVPLDFVDDLAHVAPGLFEFVITATIDFDSIRTARCFKLVEAHCDSFLRSTTAGQRDGAARGLFFHLCRRPGLRPGSKEPSQRHCLSC